MQQENHGSGWITGSPIKHSDAIGFDSVDGSSRHTKLGFGCTGRYIEWLRLQSDTPVACVEIALLIKIGPHSSGLICCSEICR